MKNEWQTKKLGNLCEIELGKTPARANKTFWDEKRETNNVWLSIADLLNADDNIVVDSKEYLSDKGAAISKIVSKGTLLVSFKLTLGRLAFAGSDLFTNEAIAALTILNERELSKEFLFYFLHFFDWRKAAENDVKLKGMTLNKAKLKEMDVHFPPFREQKQIVNVLDEVFEKTTKAKENAEKNLQNARELFESYLQSIFANSGDDWEEIKLGDIGKVSMCKRIFKDQTANTGDIPFYKIGTFGKEPNAYISKEIYEDFRKKFSFPKKGDILISAAGTIGRRVKYDGGHAYFQDSNIVWIDNDEKQVLNDYLYHFYGACNWNSTKGATISRLYNDNLKQIIIVFPKSLAKQRAIIAKLDALSAETKKLEAIYHQKLTDLDELKKSFLHKSFNSELAGACS